MTFFVRILFTMLCLAISHVVAQAGGKSVHVQGYTRKDGTYVAPHMRSAPGSGSSIPTPRYDAPTGPRLEPRTTARGQEDANPAEFKPAPTTAPALATAPAPAVRSLANDRIKIKNVNVEVRSARVSRSLFVNRSKHKISAKASLVIELAICLDRADRPVGFLTFAGPKVNLKNQKNISIKHIETDGEGLWPDGRRTELSNLTTGKIVDPLVFEVPEDFTEELKLEVFWEYAGNEPIVFLIPASQISK